MVGPSTGDDGANHPIESPERPRRLITKRELRRRVPLSFPTIWKMMRQNRFPPARIIGGKTVWLEDEIDALFDTLPLRRYKSDTQPDGK
jgi:predicted DNA-binding transcriptional regulator AlpA